MIFHIHHAVIEYSVHQQTEYRNTNILETVKNVSVDPFCEMKGQENKNI